MSQYDEQWCCTELKENIRNSEIELVYDKVYRYFGIKYKLQSSFRLIDYCPWCGNKLPKTLGKEFVDILRDEYNFELTCFNEDRLPEEFKSDEWWKKRGL